MKHLITTAIAAAIMFPAVCGENLLKNGDFEQVSKTAKSTSKYLMAQIKNGWDLGNGPIATLPAGFGPNGGKCKIRMIEVGANGENKEHVHGGKVAAYFENFHGHMTTSSRLKPGKYEITYWYKGKGEFLPCAYRYGINPATGKLGKFMGTQVLFRKKMNAAVWTQDRQTFEIPANGVVEASLALAAAGATLYLDDIVVKAVK